MASHFISKAIENQNKNLEKEFLFQDAMEWTRGLRASFSELFVFSDNNNNWLLVEMHTRMKKLFPNQQQQTKTEKKSETQHRQHTDTRTASLAGGTDAGGG